MIYHKSFETDAEAIADAKILNAQGVPCHVSKGYDITPAVLVIESDEPVEGATLFVGVAAEENQG